jgi:hypothetical protein
LRHLLLTGAGFSRNWGGWLAYEVFEYLLGCDEISNSPQLRQLLWQHQQQNGFESALAEVQRNYIFDHVNHLNDLRRLQLAINGMFGHMNRNFFEEQRFEWTQDREMTVTHFLARFDALFTLNQDLLLEHHYNPENDGPPGRARWLGLQLPGMVAGPAQMPPAARGLAQWMWVAGDQGNFQVQAGMQPLFKLHGSTSWSDRINESVMILGDNKARDIGMFPILNWYFERFEEYLCQPDTRLMVIGYGFRDAHVNEVIIRGVRDHGLKLYVIDPAGSDLAKRLNPTANAQIQGRPTELEDAFAAGLIGASRRSLREIFGSDKVEFQKVKRFFENQ